MGFENLKAPSRPLLKPEIKPPSTELEELRVPLSLICEKFADRLRGRLFAMGRDPQNLPVGELVKAYKFENRITPINELVTPELATEIRKKYFRIKAQRELENKGPQNA